MGFKLEDAIGYTMEKTVKILREELQAAFRQAGYDLTPYQFHILYMLWEEEGLFLTQLKQGSIVDSPTVTRNVDFLEKRGYVVRKADGEDRRKTRLYLTERGKTAQKDLMPVQIRHYERSREGIDESEIAVLHRIAGRVRENLER